MNERVLVAAPSRRWREYLELCKPRVVALIAFTAVVGMFLASPGNPGLDVVIIATVGIAVGAGAGAAINHLADRSADRIMGRTRGRPLPSGRIEAWRAATFATALAAGSALLLASTVNVLTAVLTMASMVGYSVVYTLFLKRATPQNIVIGGAAGAMPPVLGWTAVTGELHGDALLLFLIVFTWTPPHFWALAIHRRREYARADIPMLPVTHGVAFTRLQILLYTILLSVVTVLPFVTRMSGGLYLAGTLVLNAGFLWRAAALYRGVDERMPMRTFGYSIFYLTGIFSLLLVDHYVGA